MAYYIQWGLRGFSSLDPIPFQLSEASNFVNIAPFLLHPNRNPFKMRQLQL
jgi:hypothetical protein